MLTGSELGTDQEGRVHARLTVPFREGRDYALSIEPLRGRQPRPGGQVLALRRGSRVMYQSQLTSTATTVGQLDPKARLVVTKVEGKDVLVAG